MFTDGVAQSGRCIYCRVAQLVERTLEVELKPHKILALIRKKVRSAVRVRPRRHSPKNYISMEQTKIQRDIDREEIKRIWQQLAIGTALALAGLVFMGIGEMICRWIEGV